jgi:hypothetical protein
MRNEDKECRCLVLTTVCIYHMETFHVALVCTKEPKLVNKKLDPKMPITKRTHDERKL